MNIDIIAIENCTYCDAECVMCVRNKYTGPLKCMEQELFEKCVNEAVNLGVNMINICGFGECLLDPELERKLIYCKTSYPNIKIAFTTTGYKMKGHLLDVICEYVDEINISMYGIKKSTYEMIHRGKLKYDDNKRNIDELLDRENKPYVILSYLDMKINHDELEEWKEYYEGRANQINVWKLNRWPHSGNCDMTFKKLEPCRCFRIDTLNGLYIKVDGKISPCCFDYNTELSIGDINRDSLENILSGEKVKMLKKMQDDDLLRNSNLICGDCDQLYSREGALVYSNNKHMKSRKHSLLPEKNIYGY